MGSKEIAAQLAEYEREEARLASDLDAEFLLVRAALARRASEFVAVEIKRGIEINAEHAQQLGKDKLRTLKDGLRDLQERMPSIVEALTKDKRLWPHHASPPKNDGYGQPPEYIENVLRESVSAVGSLLVTYKLMETRPGYGSNWAASGTTARYVTVLKYELREIPEVAQYEKHVREFKIYQEKVERTQRSLAAAKATELFDSA